MTLFASVALFRRGDGIVFKAPRKEAGQDKTQARKSAARYWRGNIVEPDVLTKIILVHTIGPLTVIAERSVSAGRDNPWVEFQRYHADAAKQPHIAACLAELGIDPAAAPPPMPDTLEINGIIYRREI